MRSRPRKTHEPARQGTPGELDLARLLRELAPPEEAAAQARAWPAVRAAHRSRTVRSGTLWRRLRVRYTLVPLVSALLAGLAFTPAGASVRRAVSHALAPAASRPREASALAPLPTPPLPGTLLVSSASGGTWLVSSGGGWRRLGPWPQASWSPHGLYVLAAGGSEVAALDRTGRKMWVLWYPQPRDPRWYGPDGYRVAFRSGRALIVAGGDGTAPHTLAAAVAPVAPAWRTGHPYELAYVAADGRVIVRGADTGRTIAVAAAPGRARALQWSADGRELFVLGTAGAILLTPSGGAPLRGTPSRGTAGAVVRPLPALRARSGAPVLDAALSPDGTNVAFVRAGLAGGLFVAALPAGAPRRLLYVAGLRQVVWSADGQWLQAAWPAGDEWLFTRAAGPPTLAGMARVSQRLAPAGRGDAAAALEGWCCTAAGTAG